MKLKILCESTPYSGSPSGQRFEMIVYALNGQFWEHSERAEERKLISYSTPLPASLSDDLLTRTWQLRRTLVDLDFCPEDIEEAIKTLLSLATTYHDENARRMPSGTWGLDECFRWLGFKCHPDRLPDYHTAENLTLVQRHEEEERRKAKIIEDLNPAPTPKKTQSSTEAASGIEEPPSSSDEEEYDTDNPEHLVKRYLKLMERLHKANPGLTDVVREAKRNRKKQTTPRAPGSEVPKVQRILDQIKLLESDMLFDKDAAQIQWADRRHDLEVHTVSIPRSKAKAENSAESLDRVVQKSTNAQDIKDTRNNADSEDSDDLVGLGNFLVSLPEDGGAQSLAISTEASKSVTNVQSRDFGKWSGMQPRRVLEDACRSRDAGVKLTFQATAEDPYAKHSLEIRWSDPQDLQPQCPIDEVTLQASQTYAKFIMDGVSTPDKSQSEAYIATVGLYGLFVNSAKEEKAYIRLPGVWRGLYAELRDTSKMKTEEADKTELNELRELGNSHSSDLLKLQRTRSQKTSQELRIVSKQPHSSHEVNYQNRKM